MPSRVHSKSQPNQAVRFQLFTDGASIVLRKYYYTRLNHISTIFRQPVFNITTLINISNFSVIIFLNFYFIPSVKVLGNSNRLQESIKDTINTLRLYTMCEDWVQDEHLTF